MFNSQKQLYAVTAEKSRGRLRHSSSAGLCDPFQEDINRIIHSAAFRRLSYKTQVFVNDYTKADYYRTRLTHSLEVAQIGKVIAANLGLSMNLTEALCLAHDLGHPPFGHAGEDALSKITHGKFDHNVHCFKIVTDLEEQYMGYNGLNLSWEILEGIVKHNGENTDGNAPKFISNYSKNVQNLELDLYPCLEAQVSYLADDIAYMTHDIEDGMRAVLFTFDDLAEVKIVADRLKEIKSKDKSRLPYKLSRELSFYIIRDVVSNTKAQLAKHNIKTLDDVKIHRGLLVQCSDLVFKELKQLRDFLFKNMYKSRKLIDNLSFYVTLLTELFQIYVQDPKKLPESWYQKLDYDLLEEVVLDYIAGMTDVYAIKQYYNLV